MTNYVLFHAKSTRPFIPCIDGLFAAYAAKSGLPSDTRLVPAMYGAENAPSLKLDREDTVYLLDLTYPSHVLQKWADQAHDLVILDHHETAMQDLAGFSKAIVEFDMSRSGAMIAWNYFHPRESAPYLFHYVQDYDLWVKRLPGCDRIHIGLLDMLDKKSVDEALQIVEYFSRISSRSAYEAVSDMGAIAEEEIAEAIQNAVKNHSTRIVGGYTVPYFRCRTKREKQAYSLIGHELNKVKLKSWIFGKPNKEAPFAVVQTGGGWALRSEDHHEDVSVIAKSLGGGGHRNAAGCRAGEWW